MMYILTNKSHQGKYMLNILNELKYDCSMRSLLFKYNVSYNINIVNLNSSVWDKFCEYCAL